MSSYRLLIAEDDQEIGGLLQRYFTARGVDVELASDGAAAWQAFLDRAPDVVLTDMMMPRLSGSDLLLRIRGHPTRARTPVVIMGAQLHSDKDEQELMERLKVERAFRKPLALAELLGCTDRLASSFHGKSRQTSSAKMNAVMGTPVPSTPRAQTMPPRAQTMPPSMSATPPAARASATTQSRMSAVPSANPSSSRLQAVTGQTARSASSGRLAPVPDRPRFDPFADTPATPPPGQAAPITFATPQTPSLPMLVQQLMRAFESRVNGLLAVQSQDVVRKITFVDGVIVDVRSSSPHEEDGVALITAGLITAEQERALAAVGWEHNLADHAVARFGLKPSAVLRALEQHTRTLLRRALLGAATTAPMIPLAEPMALHGRFRLDPLEALMDACMRLPDESIAYAAFEPHMELHVHRGFAFNERVVLLARVCPTSATPGAVLDVPTVREALRRVTASNPQGARELLALMLTETLRVASSDYFPTAGPRAAALTSTASGWETTNVEAHHLAIREAVAREWIRTSGMHPTVILNVAPSPDVQDVKAAHALHLQRFGPPSLDDADLGPAKTYLSIVRARREAALQMLARG